MTLFPPPSSFIRFAIESDFRVGFGKEGMPIPAAIASRGVWKSTVSPLTMIVPSSGRCAP